MEYINGHTLGDIEDKLNYDEKIKIGQKLRLITGNLNSKCEKFNHINIIERDELPAIICELFCFDKAFMIGYFGEKSIAYVTEQCFKGLLLHQFGSNIIKCNLGTLDKIDSLKALKENLYLAIDSGKQIFD